MITERMLRDLVEEMAEVAGMTNEAAEDDDRGPANDTLVLTIFDDASGSIGFEKAFGPREVERFSNVAELAQKMREMGFEFGPDDGGVVDAIRSNLQPGDIVTVREDSGREVDYEVRQKPWVLRSGHAVVGLKGKRGGYSLDRVVKVVRYAEDAGKDVPP